MSIIKIDWRKFWVSFKDIIGKIVIKFDSQARAVRIKNSKDD